LKLVIYGYIYRIWQLSTLRNYVGQSCNAFGRLRQHSTKNSKNSSKHLIVAISEFGLDDFCFEIITTAYSKLELDELEVRLGVEYNALFPIGFCDRLGHGRGLVSESTRLLLRRPKGGEFGKSVAAGQRRRYQDPLEHEKTSKALIGKKYGPMSVCHRRKISKALTGIPKPEGFGAAVSRRQIGRPLSARAIENSSTPEVRKRAWTTRRARGKGNHTESTRKKIGVANSNPSVLTREKMRNSQLLISKEIGERTRKANLGRKHPEDCKHCLNLRGKPGRVMSDDAISRRIATRRLNRLRPVLLSELQPEEFISNEMNEAAE
jgi:hypothetical protein